MQQESLQRVLHLSLPAVLWPTTPWSMPATEKDLLNLFQDLGIEHTLYRHPPFFTVEDGRAHHAHMPGGHCKCLFLKDKKSQMILAAIHEDLTVDLKRLAEDLGLGRLSFCNEERMACVLGVTPGAVTPFALVNVKKGALKEKESLTVVVDRHLQDFDVIHFHPLHNEATVAISPADLLRFIHHCGFEPVIRDFS